MQDGNKEKTKQIKNQIEIIESDPRAYAKKYNETQEAESFPIPERFYTLSKFDKIKQLLTYYPEEKELGKYLWKKYFIPYIKDSEHRIYHETKECLKLIKEIEREFGTIVFYDAKYNRTPLDSLHKIKNELMTWKIASKRTTKYPTCVDLTIFKPDFVSTNTTGYCQNQTYIADRGVGNVMRHEMAHLVDRKLAKCEKRMVEADIPEKFVAEMNKHVRDPEHYVAYARKGNWNEWKAVSIGDADARKFSTEYRQELENKGMPRYALNLMSHDEAFESLLRKKYGQERSSLIDKIKEALNGELPNYVSEELLKHPQYMQKAEEIIDHRTFKNAWEFLSEIRS